MTDGSAQDEENAFEVYTFDTTGEVPVLSQILSADDFLTSLSTSGNTAAQVALDDDTTDATAPAMDAFYTDGDPLPTGTSSSTTS